MSRAAPVIVLWAVFLAVLTAVAEVAFNPPDPETPALLGGAAGAALLGGATIALRRLGAPQDRVPRPLPDLSPWAVWLALSIALLALAAALGPWLAYIAGGMVLVGLGGLVREARAQRDSVRKLDRQPRETGR